MELGSILYSRNLKINGGIVNIYGDIKLSNISDEHTVKDSKVIINSISAKL